VLGVVIRDYPENSGFGVKTSWFGSDIGSDLPSKIPDTYYEL
jgi:hypothetical protein